MTDKKGFPDRAERDAARPPGALRGTTRYPDRKEWNHRSDKPISAYHEKADLETCELWAGRVERGEIEVNRLAQEVGISKSVLKRMCQEHGIHPQLANNGPRPKRPYEPKDMSTEQVQEVLALPHLTAKEVLVELVLWDISVHVINKIRSEYGDK